VADNVYTEERTYEVIGTANVTTILQNCILLSPMSPSDFALMAIHGKIWALLKKIYTDTISGCSFPSFLKISRNLTNL
jgi:hypothetical protein